MGNRKQGRSHDITRAKANTISIQNLKSYAPIKIWKNASQYRNEIYKESIILFPEIKNKIQKNCAGNDDFIRVVTHLLKDREQYNEIYHDFINNIKPIATLDIGECEKSLKEAIHSIGLLSGNVDDVELIHDAIKKTKIHAIIG
jgi:hypothetical protein